MEDKSSNLPQLVMYLRKIREYVEKIIGCELFFLEKLMVWREEWKLFYKFISSYCDIQQPIVDVFHNQFSDSSELLCLAEILKFYLRKLYQSINEDKTKENTAQLDELMRCLNIIELAGFSPEKFQNQPLSEMIEELSNKMETSEHQGQEHVTVFLTDMELLCRFNEEVSKEIVTYLDPGLKTTESLFYWARSYLMHKMFTHPSVCQFNYPYVPMESGVWLKRNYINVSMNKPVHNSLLTQSRIIRYPEGSTSLTAENIETKFGDECHTLLYHGTALENVSSILNAGIDLRRGKKKNIFSYSDGFYTYESFEAACRWARSKSTNKKYAVIVFKIPREILVDFQLGEGLNLSIDIEKWKKVVLFFLKRKRDGILEADLYEAVNDARFIRGPVPADILKFKRYSNLDLYKINNVAVQCICFKDELPSLKLQDCICAVIFYHSDL
ncbi:hypothetical protein Btru_061320 [Bulinus truncatus]|nr:hypothetical protein Btru_061320 [Bulinus truncatus]